MLGASTYFPQLDVCTLERTTGTLGTYNTVNCATVCFKKRNRNYVKLMCRRRRRWYAWAGTTTTSPRPPPTRPQGYGLWSDGGRTYSQNSGKQRAANGTTVAVATAKATVPAVPPKRNTSASWSKLRLRCTRHWPRRSQQSCPDREGTTVDKGEWPMRRTTISSKRACGNVGLCRTTHRRWQKQPQPQWRRPLRRPGSRRIDNNTAALSSVRPWWSTRTTPTQHDPMPRQPPMLYRVVRQLAKTTTTSRRRVPPRTHHCSVETTTLTVRNDGMTATATTSRRTNHRRLRRRGTVAAAATIVVVIVVVIVPQGRSIVAVHATTIATAGTARIGKPPTIGRCCRRRPRAATTTRATAEASKTSGGGSDATSRTRNEVTATRNEGTATNIAGRTRMADGEDGGRNEDIPVMRIPTRTT